MIDFVLIPEDRMKILRNNKKLIKELKNLAEVKISLKDEISIESDDSLKLMNVKKVLKAFGRGFEMKDALNLLDDEYILETIHIKEFSGKSRNRMVTLKGRVIGTNGKTKKLIEKYMNVKISVYGKTICIIGKWDRVQLAKQAIEMFLSGSMHNTVYRFLEKNK